MLEGLCYNIDLLRSYAGTEACEMSASELVDEICEKSQMLDKIIQHPDYYNESRYPNICTTQDIQLDNLEESIGIMCSVLGQRILLGDTDALKALFVASLEEYAALIRVVTDVQSLLTGVEIHGDNAGCYSNEFLFYLAMLYVGDTSELITKDLGTAKICLEKVRNATPLAAVRLNYISLLESDEPDSSDVNLARIEVLRKAAALHDWHSQVVLSKIAFYQFLREYEGEEFTTEELPTLAIRLLQPPCQGGYPLAWKFLQQMRSIIPIPDILDNHIFGGYSYVGGRRQWRAVSVCAQDLICDYNKFKSLKNLQICKKALKAP